MLSKEPKNTSRYYWTEHAKFKMRFYGLSEQKVLGVIRRPKRKEEGIVKNTTAVMQPISPKIINKKLTWKQEIWVMIQKQATCNMKQETRENAKFPLALIRTRFDSARRGGIKGEVDKKLKIISAWRYPGVSPEKNPIPFEILRELENIESD